MIPDDIKHGVALTKCARPPFAPPKAVKMSETLSFQVAIHSPRDQPIMALTDIDLSPGFVTQLSVTPVLRITTEKARDRFEPFDRGCYFDGELDFKYLPKTLYR